MISDVSHKFTAAYKFSQQKAAHVWTPSSSDYMSCTTAIEIIGKCRILSKMWADRSRHDAILDAKNLMGDRLA